MRQGASVCRVREGSYALMSVLLLIYLMSGQARAVPIDLNDFFFDPTAPIEIAADGSSALLREDPGFFALFLSNIPGLGDPQLIRPGVGARLSLQYSFIEPQANDDVFHVALLDGATGSLLRQGLEFFVSDSGTGSIEFDLSAFTGMVLGLQLELVAGLADTAFDSLLRVSNLQLITPDGGPAPTPIPAAATLWLLLLGMGTLAGSRLRQLS
jgi:hypothetical protein